MSAVLLTGGVMAAGWAAHAYTLRRRLRQARRDPLTGLWTRDAFEESARRILARCPSLVVIVDLNHFKQVNDTSGHQAGDEVLRETARRLQHWSGRGVAGRLGGDELVAVRPITEPDPEQLVAHLYQVLRLPGGVSSSVGAVMAPPGIPLDVALGDADAAMYQAKRSGGDWRLGEPTQVPPVPRRYKRTGIPWEEP